jgi:hypothetical protein
MNKSREITTLRPFVPGIQDALTAMWPSIQWDVTFKPVDPVDVRVAWPADSGPTVREVGRALQAVLDPQIVTIDSAAFDPIERGLVPVVLLEQLPSPIQLAAAVLQHFDLQRLPSGYVTELTYAHAKTIDTATLDVDTLADAEFLTAISERCAILYLEQAVAAVGGPNRLRSLRTAATM